MKFLKSLSMSLIILLPFVACKKDGTSKSVSIEGTWEGKWGNGNSNPSLFFSLRFNPGGVLEELGPNGEVKGTGTWEKEINNIIEGSYFNTVNNAKYSIMGAFYPSKGILLGNWGHDESATDGGLWEMTIKK
jgi:hypothetical protein